MGQDRIIVLTVCTTTTNLRTTHGKTKRKKLCFIDFLVYTLTSFPVAAVMDNSFSTEFDKFS